MAERSPKRFRVLDTPVDCVDMAGALAFVDEYVRHGSKPGTILSVNPEKVFAFRENPFLHDFFEQAALLIPDGIGMVKALKFLHRLKVARVPGADLMQNICAVAPKKGYRIFIYGASEEVNRVAVEKLRQRHPGIQIVGRTNGYVKPEEMGQLIDRINQAQTDIIFVGLGSPGQELWMSQYLPRLNIKLCQGIGGTLDTIAGTVKRAPVCFQALGLEWLYRLICQPSRWRRQIVYPVFVFEVILEIIKRTKKCPDHMP